MSSLIYRFVVFTAIQHKHVVTLDEVTHRISRMMYWCHSLIFYKIIHMTLDLIVTTVDMDQVKQLLLLFVWEGHRTPFATILETKRLISAITKNETPLPWLHPWPAPSHRHRSHTIPAFHPSHRSGRTQYPQDCLEPKIPMEYSIKYSPLAKYTRID